MAMRLLKPFSTNSDAATIRKGADVWNAEFDEEEVKDEDAGQNGDGTPDEDGNGDSEEDIESDLEDESEDEFAAGNGDRFPKLSDSRKIANYRMHRKKGTAKLELLLRLLTWAPRSMGICQWCVRYKPQARKYWSKWKSLQEELRSYSVLKMAVDEELKAEPSNYLLFDQWRTLQWLSADLKKELRLGRPLGLVGRWSKNSRGYETVVCFINQHVKDLSTLFVRKRDSERSLVLTVRKTPNRCPRCSLDEAEKLVPISAHHDILVNLTRLQELRNQTRGLFHELLEDLSDPEF